MAEFTGERVVPGQVDADLWNEHLARYAFAARLARHKRVLEMGCGTGYGSAELARVAIAVTGMDVAQAALAHARDHYAAPHLNFLQASCVDAPFRDASFDLVVSFEVLEHIVEWRQMLLEARRVLRPGGQFIVSTPNKLYYAESRKLAGANPYHEHEFEFDEFCEALRSLFPSVSLFLQNHAAGIVFQPIKPDQAADVSIAGQAIAPEESHFFIAVCALGPQLGAPTFVYIPSTANILREREQHIQRLEHELATKNAWLEESREEHEKLVEMYRGLQIEIEQKNQWAGKLDAEMKERRERILQLQAELAEQNEQATRLAEGYEAQLRHMEEEQAKLVEWAREIERTLNEQHAAAVGELARCVELLHDAERLVEERTTWALALDAELGSARVMIEQTRSELDATRSEFEIAQAKLQAATSAVETYHAQMNMARNSRWVKLGRKFGVGPEFRED